MANTGKLNLPLIDAAQAQKHVTHNEALLNLDVVVQASVIDRDLTAPPGSPADGDAYIPASGATGDWTSKDLNIAVWQDGVWKFFARREGWVVYVDDEDIFVFWDGAAWQKFLDAVGALQNISKIGINATADTTNRLSVTTPSVLFNAETDDINVTLNKAAIADDVRFVFQTNFSTRAMFGTLGDDDFTIKVSPDGVSFKTGIIIDKDDGMVAIPEHPKFSATSNFDNYIAANTWTKINFNSTNHNDQGDFDAGNARFTAPADGYYSFGALFNFKENSAVPSFIAMKLYVGGVAVANTEQRYTGAIVTLETSLNTHSVLKLASGNQVELYVYFATNDGYVEASTCAFWGAKIP